MRFKLVFLGAFSIAAMAASLRLADADRWAQRARLTDDSAEYFHSIGKAVELNPCETKYAILMINPILRVVVETRDPKPLKRAAGHVTKIARCHPNDAAPRYIMGHVMLVRAQLGEAAALGVAEVTLAEARGLDPTFQPIKDLQQDLVALKQRQAEHSLRAPH